MAQNASLDRVPRKWHRAHRAEQRQRWPHVMACTAMMVWASRGTRGAGKGGGGLPMRAARMLFLFALAACGDDNNNVTFVDDTVAEGHARGNAFAAQTSTELTGTDYQVVIGKSASILAALNDG